VEYLKDTESFGQTFKKGEDESLGDDLEKFFAKLLPFFERRIFNRTSKRVNFLLTRVNDQKLEIIANGNSDKDEDGNWRFYEDSGNLIIQKRVSGTWTNYLLQSGDADGQMLFWDGVKWAKTETSELFWDDVNKRLGINQSSPTSTLDVNETVTVKRLLAGGVTE
jgi:hypothetical protein